MEMLRLKIFANMKNYNSKKTQKTLKFDIDFLNNC